LEGIRKLTPRPTVFFGGFGEPLSHPAIIEMIRRAKVLGATVELITNGVLLDEQMVLRLLEVELDSLWVSLDGAFAGELRGCRLGATLPQVIANLERPALPALPRLAHEKHPAARHCLCGHEAQCLRPA
jgi:Predicted Fe-S oxidoreductases